MIKSTFNGLDSLYFQSPLKLTSSHVIGQLLTNTDDGHHYCGHVMPPGALEQKVILALRADTVEAIQ